MQTPPKAPGHSAGPKPTLMHFKMPGEARSTPMQLETQVLPMVIKKVGDVKSGCLTMAMVDAFLVKHHLKFDRNILRYMFQEADYGNEGFLTLKDLLASCQGRYPKRRYTMLWRQLIALLLGMEELHVNDERSLLVDARLSTEKYIKKRPGTGKTYNCESMFTTDVHELPNTRNTMRPKSRGRPVTSDWQAVTERTQLVEDYNTTGGFLPPGTAIDGGRRLATAPGSLGGALGATRRPTLLGSMTVRGEGMLLTTEGLRTTGRTEEEAAFNASLTGSRPATSISQQRQFADFATGQGIVSQQRSGNAAAAMIATFDEEAKAVEALTGTDKFLPRKSPIKAWSATLPQTPTTLTRSSLNDLRNNVQSHKSVGTMHTSPFTTIRRDFRPLSPDQMDLKKVLGQSLDLSRPLERVPPLRPTTHLHQHDYVQWGDYRLGCPTSPPRWWNEHPATLKQTTVDGISMLSPYA